MKPEVLTFTEKIKSINLPALMEAEGASLWHRGNKHLVLCEFHDDHNPSMIVFEDNHAKCLACGWYGDAADYIQQRHGLSFKETLRYLGLSTGPMTNELSHKIADSKRKRIQKEKREAQIRDLIFTLALLIRTTHRAMARLTPENFNDRCSILDSLSWWEHCHDILVFGEEEEKNEAIAELSNFETISRKPLFKPGFDYRGWLRETYASKS